MNTLLQLNSSLFSQHGQSTQLADQFVSAWLNKNPGTQVIVRDLSNDPVPHLDGSRFQSFLTAPDSRTVEQHAVVAYSDGLIAELKRANVIVIGLPLYNFGIPSTLKAYIDHISRAGETFQYTETGPVGLLTGKQAFVIAARGGHYVGTALDTQTNYVRDILRFVGIEDVRFVYAEGLNMGEASKEKGLADAAKANGRLSLVSQSCAEL